MTAIPNLLAQDSVVAEAAQEAVASKNSPVKAVQDAVPPSSEPVEVVQDAAPPPSSPAKAVQDAAPPSSEPVEVVQDAAPPDSNSVDTIQDTATSSSNSVDADQGSAISDSPISDTPISDTPISDSPISDTPISDTPISDSPISDTPIPDTLMPDSSVEAVQDTVSNAPVEAVQGTTMPSDTAEVVQSAATATSSPVEGVQSAVTTSGSTEVVQDAADVLQEAASNASDNLVPSSIQEGANQISSSSVDLAPFLFAVALAIGIGLAFYTLFYTLLRNTFRQFKSDLPLVALGTSRLPLTLVIIALGLNTAFGLLPEAVSTGTFLQGVEKVLSALMILSVTYWVVELFRKVVIYALKQYAADSEAAWDDVLVPFLESAVPIVLYVGGAFLAFQAVGVDLSGIWVALGGLSFVLGLAAQGILSNFFSGLVLLIDTPFRFGDVIMHNDERAIVRKIGLRTTNLYLIDSHCEVFVPNGSMQSSDIVNLSRPTPHYYYTVGLSLPSEVNPQRASKLMQDVVLAHPDTLGDISRKLELTSQYFGFSGLENGAEDKREAGRVRLNREKSVNDKLIEVEQQTRDLKSKIKRLEAGGLDDDEIESVKYDFLSLCKAIGVSPQKQAGGLRGERLVLDEDAENPSEDSLIHTIRSWYSAWLKDPDLVEEDRELLPQEWEQKIGTLKKKFSRFFAVVLKPDGQETRLDDYIEEIEFWLRDSFKSSRNEWQDPKVWIGEQYMVRFYIDDITLERGQRGLRIQNEVHRELVWHLRQTYLLR